MFSVVNQIKNAFPIEPIPNSLFQENSVDSDIKRDINNTIFNRYWLSLSLRDWINLVDVNTIANLLTPEAFHYYLPSILIHSLGNPNYIDLGIRAILPKNNKFIEKGEWWDKFFSLFTEEQKKAIQMYLFEVDDIIKNGSAESFYIDKALDIWF